MSKENGGPAFPCTPEHSVRMNGDGGSGMSLRDYFAANALQAGAIGLFQKPQDLSVASIPGLASACYLIADAMLAARSA